MEIVRQTLISVNLELLFLLLLQHLLAEAFQVVLLLKYTGEAELCATCDAHKQ